MFFPKQQHIHTAECRSDRCLGRSVLSGAWWNRPPVLWARHFRKSLQDLIMIKMRNMKNKWDLGAACNSVYAAWSPVMRVDRDGVNSEVFLLSQCVYLSQYQTVAGVRPSVTDQIQTHSISQITASLQKISISHKTYEADVSKNHECHSFPWCSAVWVEGTFSAWRVQDPPCVLSWFNHCTASLHRSSVDWTNPACHRRTSSENATILNLTHTHRYDRNVFFQSYSV